jgi:hypothetical protein
MRLRSDKQVNCLPCTTPRSLVLQGVQNTRRSNHRLLRYVAGVVDGDRVGVPHRELALDVADVVAVGVENLVLVGNEIGGRKEVPKRRQQFVLRFDGCQRLARIGVANRPVLDEQRVILIEDDHLLTGARVGDGVVAPDIQDAAGFHAEGVLVVAGDERELLFHLEHLLFPAQDDVAVAVADDVLVPNHRLFDLVAVVVEVDRRDVVLGGRRCHGRVVDHRRKKPSARRGTFSAAIPADVSPHTPPCRVFFHLLPTTPSLLGVREYVSCAFPPYAAGCRHTYREWISCAFSRWVRRSLSGSLTRSLGRDPTRIRNASGTATSRDMLTTNFYNHYRTMGDYGISEGHCRRRTPVR